MDVCAGGAVTPVTVADVEARARAEDEEHGHRVDCGEHLELVGLGLGAVADQGRRRAWARDLLIKTKKHVNQMAIWMSPKILMLFTSGKQKQHLLSAAAMPLPLWCAVAEGRRPWAWAAR